MKNSEKIRISIFLIIIAALTLLLLLETKKELVQVKKIEPEGYIPILYYNEKYEKIFIKTYSYHHPLYHKQGIDSCVHEIDIKNGENNFYFVLFDMSVQFKIIKYNEN